MYEQIKLNYSYSDLEPYIDRETIETHYSKHHATYTKNFIDIIKKVPQYDGKPIKEILWNLDNLPQDVRQGIRNNGGGYYNHNFYFEQLSPNPVKEPSVELMKKITEDFGSFDALKGELSKTAMAQFGSGWAWLIMDDDGKLFVTATPNQDNPWSKGVPHLLLTIDVWEHAYYLKYKNLRVDYVKELFNIIDWSVVNQRYEEAMK